MKRSIFVLSAIIALAAVQGQNWQQNPIFQQGWSPFGNQMLQHTPTINPDGGVAPPVPISHPANELIPEQGSSEAGSTNEAKSGKMDGALYANAQSDSSAKVTSLDKAKFQLALGKGSAGAIAVEG